MVGRLAEPPLKQRLLAAGTSVGGGQRDETDADEADGDGDVAGVLVRRNMNLHVMDPRDLSSTLI